MRAIRKPITAPWGLRISDVDFKKLSAGFEPRDMDDKWCIRVSDKNQCGNISVRLIRSMAFEVLYLLSVNPNPEDSENGSGGAVIEAITWGRKEGHFHVSEEEAKETAVGVMRGYTRCYIDTFSKDDEL